MLTKQQVIVLSNLGILAITNHDLDSAHAYKVVKFRREFSSALEAIGKEEESIRKDAGIESAEEFDKELKSLRENKARTKDEDKKLEDMEAQLKRFIELRAEMLKEEMKLDCKALPYDEWHKLQNENKAIELNGKKADILSGFVEDWLEGVLWTAPEESETN